MKLLLKWEKELERKNKIGIQKVHNIHSDFEKMSDAKLIPSILNKFGITALNPMQEEACKAIQTKSDVVLLSPTGTGRVADRIRKDNFTLEQIDRERALIKFRNGTNQLLLATDLAARGLDIPEIKFILHYHLPPRNKEFTHRNGPTVRMPVYMLKCL